ncbi:uncharacterized protein LOC141856045 [Brevipalpus obovatus]|uniref:uncharacterized protein LOC141856045 n=1 Tax=Brevipalpus obovatus TaxID=246614 RepID=UPI003D9F70DA
MSKGRSLYLDQLLQLDDDVISKQETKKGGGKSVRFNFLETDTDEPSTTATRSRTGPSSRSVPNVSNSSERKDATSTKSQSRATSRSDWLDLSDGNELSSNFSSPQYRSIFTDEKKQSDSLESASSETKGSASWLDQGLEARKSIERRNVSSAPSQQPTKSPSSSEIRPQSAPSEEPDWLGSGTQGPSKSATNEVESTSRTKRYPSSDSSKILEPNEDDSLMKAKLILQAKVEILEMEKKYLITAMEQLKEGHQVEINTLKSLHEQQLSMTTNMFKKQEEMLLVERDRRIGDLRNQLEANEKEKEILRIKYNEQVDSLERECREETERLREMHKNMIQRMATQHESDIERLRRIKAQELDALNALHNQSSSLESLIDKWQANADRIENIHRSLINKEEDVFKEKIQTLDSKDKRLDMIEENWIALRREVDRERSSYQETKDKLVKLIDEQRNFVTKERNDVVEERRLLDKDRKAFEEERSKIETELNKQRENLMKEMKELKDKSDLTAERMSLLDKRDSEVNLRESEWKHEVNKEREEIGKIRNELLEERRQIMKEKTNVQESLMSLQNEQQLMEHRKILFDSEKEKLKNLAEKIAEKANEVEILGEMAIKDKIEGTKALETATGVKEQTDKKLEKIERKLAQINRESSRLEQDKQKIHQEWKILGETKNSIMCSLCSGALTKAKIWQNEGPWYPERFRSFGFPKTNLEDTDQMLLIWKIAAEEDAEELEKEKIFLNSLKNDIR